MCGRTDTSGKKLFVPIAMKLFFIFFLLRIPGFAFTQNLLLNGSFEEENICTEYKVNCAPEAWLTNDDVFNNYFKKGIARSSKLFSKDQDIFFLIGNDPIDIERYYNIYFNIKITR